MTNTSLILLVLTRTGYYPLSVVISRIVMLYGFSDRTDYLSRTTVSCVIDSSGLKYLFIECSLSATFEKTPNQPPNQFPEMSFNLLSYGSHQQSRVGQNKTNQCVTSLTPKLDQMTWNSKCLNRIELIPCRAVPDGFLQSKI